ncbi:hypothetical protein CYMTET_53536 [Cymbomonas tetramitiformis]|uniref:Uncharacterized protein n=1 Tax=Cymbomonas tetramitiformis TaxID=36881 RepID=A0AAE0EQH8_9CHLO|nr:hypothetical protein CYMTET_53536 [Cymbomonas tetramitiformis]
MGGKSSRPAAPGEDLAVEAQTALSETGAAPHLDVCTRDDTCLVEAIGLQSERLDQVPGDDAATSAPRASREPKVGSWMSTAGEPQNSSARSWHDWGVFSFVKRALSTRSTASDVTRMDPNTSMPIIITSLDHLNSSSDEEDNDEDELESPSEDNQGSPANGVVHLMEHAIHVPLPTEDSELVTFGTTSSISRSISPGAHARHSSPKPERRAGSGERSISPRRGRSSFRNSFNSLRSSSPSPMGRNRGRTPLGDELGQLTSSYLAEQQVTSGTWLSELSTPFNNYAKSFRSIGFVMPPFNSRPHSAATESSTKTTPRPGSAVAARRPLSKSPDVLASSQDQESASDDGSETLGSPVAGRELPGPSPDARLAAHRESPAGSTPEQWQMLLVEHLEHHCIGTELEPPIELPLAGLEPVQELQLHLVWREQWAQVQDLQVKWCLHEETMRQLAPGPDHEWTEGTATTDDPAIVNGKVQWLKDISALLDAQQAQQRCQLASCLSLLPVPSSEEAPEMHEARTWQWQQHVRAILARQEKFWQQQQELADMLIQIPVPGPSSRHCLQQKRHEQLPVLWRSQWMRHLQRETQLEPMLKEALAEGDVKFWRQLLHDQLAALASDTLERLQEEYPDEVCEQWLRQWMLPPEDSLNSAEDPGAQRMRSAQILDILGALQGAPLSEEPSPVESDLPSPASPAHSARAGHENLEGEAQLMMEEVTSQHQPTGTTSWQEVPDLFHYELDTISSRNMNEEFTWAETIVQDTRGRLQLPHTVNFAAGRLRGKVVIHDMGTPVSGWRWMPEMTAEKVTPLGVPINLGYRCELCKFSFPGTKPLNIMIWVEEGAGNDEGMLVWMACKACHFPLQVASSSHLLARAAVAPSGDDLGPQSLWNQLCIQIVPNRPIFVPGGLFTGIREPNVIQELQRVYDKALLLHQEVPSQSTKMTEPMKHNKNR